MKFWNFIKNEDTGDVELRITGEIVSDDHVWFYEYLKIAHTSPNAFREELAKHAGQNIIVWIDSIGGDVFAAVGIYTALMEHKGQVTVKIDGKAYSAASIIAMAGTEVLMSPGSMMLIHNPWTEAWGEAKDLRHVADLLDEVKEAIMNVYELKTGRAREEIAALMDEETPMSAATAIEQKFADGMLYSDIAAAVKDYYFNTYRPVVMNSWNKSIVKALEIKKQLESQTMSPESLEPPEPSGPDALALSKTAEPPQYELQNDQQPAKGPAKDRVFDKRVKVREIQHNRRYKISE